MSEMLICIPAKLQLQILTERLSVVFTDWFKKFLLTICSLSHPVGYSMSPTFFMAKRLVFFIALKAGIPTKAHGTKSTYTATNTRINYK